MKKIITIIVLILIIIVTCVCFYNFKRESAASSATIEGYVKQIYPDRILICYDLENTLNEEYMGDCYIPIEEDTVISDGMTIDSIKQGDHIIVTYIGTLAEVYPAEIDGTVSITVN